MPPFTPYAVISILAPTRLIVSAERVSKGLASSHWYTLVQFQDYECPPCRRSLGKIAELLRLYQGKLRVVVRHYPLDMHPSAKSAAAAAEAARLQGRFQPMHEGLLKRASLADSDIRALAEELKLDHPRFLKDWKSEGRARAELDHQAAEALGISGTPSYLLCIPDGTVWRLAQLEQLHDFVR